MTRDPEHSPERVRAAEVLEGPPYRREEVGVPPRLRGVVTRTLRTGVGLSAALLAVGIVGLGLEVAAGTVPDVSHGAGPASGGLTWAEYAILSGLLVLVGTPFARVAISVLLFAARRDRPFTVMTLFVFSVLVTSVLVGVRF